MNSVTTATNATADDTISTNNTEAAFSTAAPPSGIEFHPEAPRPQFLWQASLPMNWAVINTHPEASPHALSQLAQDFIPGHRFARKDQKLILAQLEQLVAAARDNGVLLTLLLPGVDNAGQPTSATITLRWYDQTPEYATLDTARAAAEKSKSSTTVTEQSSPTGSAWLLSSSTSQVGPLTDRRTAHHHQAYLPIATTTWTLLISGTAPDAETAESMKNIIIRLANSVTAYPETHGITIADLASNDDITSDDDSKATTPAKEGA